MLKSNLKACSIAPNQLKTELRGVHCAKSLCSSLSLQRVTELRRKRSQRNAGRDRQLAALHVTHVVASAPQELVFTHIAKLVHDLSCHPIYACLHAIASLQMIPS